IDSDHPYTGTAACCAHAASGHAAAAPPSAASSSLRPMLTVMRPSRARCVEGTIARHRRAVFTFKEGRMLVASTSVVGFGFRSGKLKRGNVFRFAPESGHAIHHALVCVRVMAYTCLGQEIA